MSAIRFLADECVSHEIIDALRETESAVDIVFIGGPDMPPKGTPDPEVLQAAIERGRVLISGDRSTMTRHVAAHYRGGGHTAGVIFLKSGYLVGRYASDLHLIWFAMDAEECIDQTDFIPY
jgi:Domain of unknown function (DUF5615)